MLKPDGVMSFLVIVDDDDSSASNTGGGDVVMTGADYVELMRQAGFTDVELVDVSDEYELTVEAWIREWNAGKAEIEVLIGPECFADRQELREEGLEKVQSGLRKRFSITGRHS